MSFIEITKLTHKEITAGDFLPEKPVKKPEGFLSPQGGRLTATD
jgi:hypothetical protein